MKLYFDSINWTVAGRKIEIIKEDDQFNPQVGLQKAKKLIESDKVDLIVGVQASNVALAVLNYMKQQKAFYVVSGAGTDAITWDRYPYLFRTSISAYQLSTPMADYVYDNLGKEIVTTASDYAGGRDVIAAVQGPVSSSEAARCSRRSGRRSAPRISAPYLTDIKSINPPVTYDFMPGADAVRFIQQYSEFGLKEKMPLTGFTIINSQTHQRARQGRGRRDLRADLYRHRRQSGEQEIRRRLPGQIQVRRRTCSRTTAMSPRSALGEALKAIDGDASNKDKLAEAMTKVKFNAPRGPFRMDPATHNPIQDIYICQVIESGGKHHDQDPLHRQGRARTRARRSTDSRSARDDRRASA